MKIVFTPSARKQFFSALAYIRQDKPSAAISFRQKVEQTLSRLSDHPRFSRSIPEFPDLPYREIIVMPYRFFYKITKNDVWVVAVWHGAQVPQTPSTR